MKIGEGTILFVEDDRVLARCYDLWARKLGFTPELVCEGGEALMALGMIKPVLIFVDMMMPGMDGPTTIKEIRQLDQSTPIICASARPAGDIRSEVYDLGANDYLEKPIRFEAFKEAILKSLKKS